MMNKCQDKINEMIETINAKELENKKLTEQDFKILFLNSLLEESTHD